MLPDGDGGGDPLAPDLGRQRLFGAALGLLGELGGDRPVLLVLEDLHWADRSTRDLLTFLCRVLQRERVCLVGTYRSDDLHRRHPLRPLVAELRRLPNVTSVQVRPFGRGETAEYLAALAGAAPTAETVERVHRRSEGNPFYAAELHATGESAELPAGLADLLLSRVERLSPDARRVVRIAAVAGRRVDDELLRLVSGLAEDTAGEALREVVSHQLLVPDGAGYSFRHALLREAVYADLLPGERTRLHAAFAELLADERTGGRRGSAAELAYHSLAAHVLPAAFAASVRAAREAGRVGAPAEEFEHYERALELWDTVPDAEAVAGTGRERVVLAAEQAAAEAGEVRRAAHSLQRLLETADPSDRLLGVRIREELSSHLGELDRDDEAQAMARAAVAMLPDGPPTTEHARALATYGKLLLWRDTDGEMPAFAEKAVAVARCGGGDRRRGEPAAHPRRVLEAAGGPAGRRDHRRGPGAGADGRQPAGDAAGDVPLGGAALRPGRPGGRGPRRRRRRPVRRRQRPRLEHARRPAALPAVPDPLHDRRLGGGGPAGGGVRRPGHPAGGGAGLRLRPVPGGRAGRRGRGRAAALAGPAAARRLLPQLHRARPGRRARPMARRSRHRGRARRRGAGDPVRRRGQRRPHRGDRAAGPRRAGRARPRGRG
ncbi:ATP-binding protein, partial [Actinomadura sp. CNU-125]|uniref:ATP-binding protein n=1 Tax=Actinomadura sp. CNU-125 TaxID=1904961 RepID=UPI00396718C0